MNPISDTSNPSNLPDSNDYVFKLVLVGDSGVGKSCILHQFIYSKFKKIRLKQSVLTFLQKTFILTIKKLNCKFGTLPVRKNSALSLVVITEVQLEL